MDGVPWPAVDRSVEDRPGVARSRSRVRHARDRAGRARAHVEGRRDERRSRVESDDDQGDARSRNRAGAVRDRVDLVDGGRRRIDDARQRRGARPGLDDAVVPLGGERHRRGHDRRDRHRVAGADRAFAGDQRGRRLTNGDRHAAGNRAGAAVPVGDGRQRERRVGRRVTTRVAGLVWIAWTKPSDHFRLQGGCPVRLTERFVGWPEQAEAGPERAAVGAGRIGTARMSVEEQPFDPVTVTLRSTFPGRPAVNVICRRPGAGRDRAVPDVPARSAAPGPASGVDAVFPGAFGHTCVTEGVMTAPGAGFTTTSAAPEDVPAQPVASLTNVTE